MNNFISLHYFTVKYLPSRTFASLCPIYILSSSGPFMDKKLYLHSVATALAKSVFPVPGGPYNNIPINKIKVIFIINTY